MTKKEQDQQEASMLLQAQPASASLWLRSGADLTSLYGRLPDPAFTESLQWPVYALESTGPASELAVFPLSSPTPEQMGVPTREDGDHIPFFASNLAKNEPVITTEDRNMDTQTTASNPEKSEKAKRKKEKKSRKVATPKGHAEDFFDWLRMHPVNGGVAKTSKKEKAFKKTRKPEAKTAAEVPALLSAENSTVLGDAVVSETLARLLARQGHTTDAVAMYEKLMEKYPNKRTNFAAAIEKLKS
ncbi:MAG: hypothetical protein JPMHGGIA_01189 [Saprospiraceae bacterium]|nr:hypothetical protein [Saprospiraceae bacterium]